MVLGLAGALAPTAALANGVHPLGASVVELSLGVAGLAVVSAGLGAMMGQAFREQPAAAAFGIGLLLWLFLDLVDQSARLGRESLDPAYQLALVLAFLAGLLLLAGPHRLSQGRAPAWLPAVLWSLGVAFHTLGEGIVAGQEAVRGTHLLEVPWTQSTSYALHKVAEGLTVGLLLGTSTGLARALAAVALVMGAPAALGGLLGAGLGGQLSVYAFALGAGAVLYPLALLGSRGLPRAPALTSGLAMAAGVLALYAAGVIHQY